jgi:formate hydrogenlyase subunit 4
MYELLLPFAFEWVYRKAHARVQRRVGPPLLQPVYDFIKLLGKEAILPEGGLLLAVSSALLLATNAAALFVALRQPQHALLALLVLFLFDVALKTFLAFAVRSPFTMQGASRLAGMKMALDPAFPLSFLAPAFVFGFGLPWPAAAAAFLPVAFAASMAELELPPFDIPTAETEIAGGWKAELSGPLLAAVHYGEYAKAVAVSALLAALTGPGFLIAKALLAFTAMALLSAALPRFSMKRVVRYLTALNIIALAEVVLSLSL